ncbi:hypothetical protein AX15_000588 [Amanita polypyramis BW_CC]|nr:hypothetical protein AX15_000588 [Amanita polypyramis BW_CC]
MSVMTSEPFGPATKADVILRSSDSVDFFVLGTLIRIVSPDLGSRIPSTEDDANVGRAIIHVDEESQILRHLLNMIYPYEDKPDINDCHLYTRVALAARRYEMTAIEGRLREYATASPLVLEEPLQMFIIASALGWDELAKRAALNTFHRPLGEMDYTKDFNLITGADLYRLVAYRFRCAAEARAVVDNNDDYRTYGPGEWAKERRGHSSWKYTRSGSPEALLKELKSCPRGSSVAYAYSLEYTDLKSGEGDISMTRSEYIRVLECRQEIEDAIELAVSKVPLDIPLQN